MIGVYDDAIPNVEAYRAAALARPFEDVHVGGLVFHGIQLATDDGFEAWLRSQFPQLTPTLSFFRQSPAGQVEPNYVHTDRDMGDWTAILYLNPSPPPGDGTTFWSHRDTGAIASEAPDDSRALLDEQRDWRDPTQWDVVGQVAARFGRVVVFPAEMFHSRSLPDNYGTGADARLVQVMFGTGAL